MHVICDTNRARDQKLLAEDSVKLCSSEETTAFGYITFEIAQQKTEGATIFRLSQYRWELSRQIIKNFKLILP